MDKELIIKLTMDKSRAEAAGQAFAASERQRIGQTLTAAEMCEIAKSKVIERENQRRIAAQVTWLEAVKGTGVKSLNDLEVKEAAKTKLVEAANAKKIQAVVDAAKTEEERIGKLLSATEIAERAKAAIIDRTNKQKIDAAVRAETVEEQQLTKSLTKEQVTFQARDALVRKHNQARIDAEIKAASSSEDSWGKTSNAVAGASQAVSGFAVQMLGLDSAKAIVGTIVENFQSAKREAMEAAKFVQGYREALLELAALKGQLGNTGKTLGEDLAFRAETLQTSAQAREFQLGALGTGQAAMDSDGVKRLIAPDEFQKALVLGGKFQAVENESAETHGRLIGSIPNLFGKRMTGEDVFAKEQQLFNINQPGGSSFGSATDQYLKNSALVTSGLITPEKMMALQSAFSISNPTGAGTNVQQLTRATVGGLGRMKGMQGVDGTPNEKWAEYLKRVGATDQMDPLQIADKISEDLDAEEGKANASGKKFNPLLHIQTHGQGNMEDANALLAYRGFRNQSLKNTFLPLAEKGPTIDEALAPLNERQRVDPVFQGRRAEISGEAAQISLGAGKEETLNSLFRTSFNRLKGRGEVVGEHDDVMNAGLFSPSEFMFGYKGKTELEAQRSLAKEAERIGIDPNIDFRVDAKTGQRTEQFMGRDRLYELSQQVQAKGGDPMAGFQGDVASAVKKLDNVASNLERAAANLDKAAAPKNPPIQARPIVQNR